MKCGIIFCNFSGFGYPGGYGGYGGGGYGRVFTVEKSFFDTYVQILLITGGGYGGYGGGGKNKI